MVLTSKRAAAAKCSHDRGRSHQRRHTANGSDESAAFFGSRDPTRWGLAHKSVAVARHIVVHHVAQGAGYQAE